ncbi:MAG: RNA 2',3'-cyclic phosphodiesterase [Thaumarchaeota archaeon]|jgi:2'-5' RNA ligase|nr:RNA 2',3'-cyclic phosphodiesterase [Candidatus Geocrenenecus arthurdayi]MCL7389037.1 RNA 2',3'-cyclic phosphodiesterase [Candidatus Geocrenenecus arthurdayi]MCL7391297.1 RNA 2',3'-cyclic phosphodiesterase [Candidatus Geocrenenecus arthurdayi]MCL7396283.1 RNA 2',3'-cyclic phosphodiesterase [Candidatus Geocrenenecus arthurdayi]MCL7403792.1 RNA 2',3'-cyclic phosphodiesterase [Candidatus Geocrenenecus arthurdayi]
MNELTRTFIAVDFDNPEIVGKIQDIQKDLKNSGIVAKDVEPQNLHLTLWFLGELPENKLKIVLSEVSRVSFNKFEVRIGGVGYFPGGSRINVIWLKVEDPTNTLNSILDQLLDSLGKKGFKYDERGFTPHLTIARVKYIKDKEKALKKLQELKDIQLGQQTIDTLKVKKSVLTAKGPIYSDLLIVKAGMNP